MSAHATPSALASLSVRERHNYRKSWWAMIARCESLKHEQFPNYGARGIKVCERWHSYEAFAADMGPKPSPGHSLDRIDNDGPYSPENCRWATLTQQVRNRRVTRTLELDGVRLPLVEWAERLGVTHQMLINRCNRGWDARRVLMTPARPPLPKSADGVCAKGHALEGENVYVYPSGTRECKACRQERHRARKALAANPQGATK